MLSYVISKTYQNFLHLLRLLISPEFILLQLSAFALFELQSLLFGLEFAPFELLCDLPKLLFVAAASLSQLFLLLILLHLALHMFLVIRLLHRFDTLFLLLIHLLLLLQHQLLLLPHYLFGLLAELLLLLPAKLIGLLRSLLLLSLLLQFFLLH